VQFLFTEVSFGDIHLNKKKKKIRISSIGETERSVTETVIYQSLESVMLQFSNRILKNRSSNLF